MEQLVLEGFEKTLMDDFFEKYPNAQKDSDGAPTICSAELGYEIFSNCDYFYMEDKCYRCWNRKLKEVVSEG